MRQGPLKSLRRAAFIALCALVVAGCPTPTDSGPAPGGPAPAAKLAFATQPSSTQANAAMGADVVVEIQDASGALVTASTVSVTVAIGTNPGSGVLSGTKTVSAVAGVATFSGLSIDKAGTGYTLSATSAGLTAALSSSFDISASTATKLVFASQPTTTVSSIAIAPAVTVQVEDSIGNLVTTSTASITIAIGTNPSAGALSGTKTVSAVNGVATFSTLKIDKAGTGYTLSAASGVLTGATSSAFNITLGGAAKLGFAVQPSTAVSAAAIAPAVVVNVLDAGGNLVTSSTASVTMAIGNNPSGGTLAGTRTVSAVAGVATFSTLSIDKAGTAYTLGATSGVLTGATSSAFNISAGAASKLAFSVQPSNAVSTVLIAPAVAVSVLDAAGNLTTSTASVTVAIGTNPSGGTLSGTATLNAISGVATFTLSIDKAGTAYTLTAASSGLTGTTSSSFNITVGGAASVVFAVQPTTTTAATAIKPAVVVNVLDAGGNIVTASTASVTIAIGNNPSGGTLSGTATVSAVAGVATFSTLNIDKAGKAYTLAASSGTLKSATSTNFDINVGAAAQLVFAVQPTATKSGAVITPAVVVNVLDAGGNLTSSTAIITMAIGINPPGNGLLRGTTSVAAVAGVATFNNLVIGGAGNGYTIVATSAGLTSATSTLFNIL